MNKGLFTSLLKQIEILSFVHTPIYPQLAEGRHAEANPRGTQTFQYGVHIELQYYSLSFNQRSSSFLPELLHPEQNHLYLFLLII